jgi:hypothetical protein
MKKLAHPGPIEGFAKVLAYENGAELRLNPKYLELVVNGRKCSTIREGVLLFPPRCELLLRFSRTASPVRVRITKSTVKRLIDLSQKEIEVDGFKTREELFAELQQYYPLITGESVVTVVHFATIRSKRVTTGAVRTRGTK